MTPSRLEKTSDTSTSSGRRYRLRLPGPTTVPSRVLNAIASEVTNHRGPEFHTVLGELQEMAKPLFKTSNDILFYSSSGTGMMEASIANIIAPGDRILIVDNGQWAGRFASIAQTYGADVEKIIFPWGQAPEADAIAARLAGKDFQAVLVTHNESSTGVVADLASIGALTRETSTLLVADAVSSIGSVDMNQDEWGVDIVLTASQKGLMCPPGIGLVSLSEKAWRRVNLERSTPRFYWDFRKAHASSRLNETPFTPPISLLLGLAEALTMIHDEGLDNALQRQKRLATGLREGCAAIGLPSFPQERLSPAVTVLASPEGLDSGKIVQRLYERYRTVVAGSRSQLAGRVIRIGTMGYVADDDILADVHFLEATMHDLGFPVSPGAGVAAASTKLHAYERNGNRR